MNGREPARPSKPALSDPHAADEAGDRPPGAPRSAIAAIVCFYLLGAIVPNVLALSLGDALHRDVFTPWMPWLILGETAVIVATTAGLGAGKRIAVRVFYGLAWPIAGLYFPLLAINLLMALGLAPGDQANGHDAVVTAVIMGVALPCPILLVRALLSVRWLNPNSRPHEWEPSARSERG